ncbi:MAG: adenosylcobinamide-GDP ribazoletransferase [Hyphomicrobiaceae bacterium]|nr:MAG: adenosylcobinamide-GDP ribazoletransferase [Hyphomicrobiaceae bacterium]
MKRFLGAIQFLTVLPVRGKTAEPARAAIYFPLVGALLGAAAWLVPTALGKLAFLIFITGGLHEDGLADVADAVREGRPAERILAILKDSRIGTYGALALIFSILFRWQALETATLPRLVAALAVSRAAMVMLAYVSHPTGSGLGAAFVSGVRRWAVALVAMQAVAAAALCGWEGAAMLAAAGVSVALLRAWFHARIGGVTGDCLGAAEQVTQTLALGIGAWRAFIW